MEDKMPSYIINAKGQRQFKPGTSVTTTTALSAGISLAPRGILGILFEADRGGEPGTVTEITNGSQLKALLPAELASVWSRILFTPGKSNRTRGGVAKALLVRVNPADRASLNLDKSAAAQITLYAADWGLYGNEIQAKVEDSGTTVTCKLDNEEYVAEGGDLPIVSMFYDPPVSVPAGWAVTAMTGSFNPNATDGNPGFTMAYAFTGPAETSDIDPRAWMAFDGAIDIAIGAQTAGASRTFVISGINKATSEADTESIVVSSASHTTSTKTWSEITAINPDNALEGDATYTGNAFALPIRTSGGVNQYAKISNVIDRIEQKAARGFDATALTANLNFLIDDMDATASPASILTAHEFDANLYDLINEINDNIPVVTAERATGAVGLPDDVVYTNMTGGANGATAQSDWEAGLTALETEEVNEIIPMTSDAAVHLATLTHCLNMTLDGRGERSCSIGVPGKTAKGSSAGQLYALALALDSRLCSIHCQTIDMYNESGVQTTYEPYYTALLTSALQAGRNPLYGITRAVVNNVISFGDYPGSAGTNWTANNDGESLIQHGYCLLEKSKQGIRVMRGNTNYTGVEAVYSSRVAVESQLLATTTFRETMDQQVIGLLTLVPTDVIRGLAIDTLDAMVKAKQIVAWDENSLDIQDVGEETKINVSVQIPVERLWVSIGMTLRV